MYAGNTVTDLNQKKRNDAACPSIINYLSKECHCSTRLLIGL
jgi:hypothetical protein